MDDTRISPYFTNMICLRIPVADVVIGTETRNLGKQEAGPLYPNTQREAEVPMTDPAPNALQPAAAQGLWRQFGRGLQRKQCTRI